MRCPFIALVLLSFPAHSWSQEGGFALDSARPHHTASVAGLTHRMRPAGRLTAEERAALGRFSADGEALHRAILGIPGTPGDSTLSHLKHAVRLYTALREKADAPRLMGALVSEEDYDRLIGHANTLRNIPLSLYLIDEAKAAHPFGRYASPKNCKHP
jgi:hypothetical protein